MLARPAHRRPDGHDRPRMVPHRRPCLSWIGPRLAPALAWTIGRLCLNCYGAITVTGGKGMGERTFASATELSAELRDRRIGCLELLDFYLARAERYNPALNAIVVWQVEQARERARAADAALARGERWGPLHGVPMTVKESFNVAGLPTTFGNPLWRDNIAAGNAFLIDRLLQAGAVVFGKTNVPYMLGDAQSYNDIYGTTNNPWDPTRSPGGSSGGEAATLPDAYRRALISTIREFGEGNQN